MADFISQAPLPIKKLFFIFPSNGSTFHSFLSAGTRSTFPANEKCGFPFPISAYKLFIVSKPFSENLNLVHLKPMALHSFSTILKVPPSFGAIDLHRINFCAISISLEFFIYNILNFLISR